MKFRSMRKNIKINKLILFPCVKQGHAHDHGAAAAAAAVVNRRDD